MQEEGYVYNVWTSWLFSSGPSSDVRIFSVSDSPVLGGPQPQRWPDTGQVHSPQTLPV